MGGVATKLIEKNTTIPTSKSQIFSTASDNQPSVDIHIIQGERSMVADNKSLGRFILEGVTPAPRGVPQIEVNFDIDANGILNVKAVDKASGKEQSIKIEASSGLSDEDVEKMKKDAELHAEDDKKKQESIEIKNSAEQLIYTSEKALKENEKKVSEEIKKDVNEKIEALKKIKDGEDTEAIKKGTEELSTSIQKVGEEVMKKMQEEQAKQAPAGGEASKEGKDNVRDAEYKPADEDEKKGEGEQEKRDDNN